MYWIGRISFVALDGEPPANLRLDELPPAVRMAKLVVAAFAPFLGDTDEGEVQLSDAHVVPPDDGLHLVYVYGHAWLTERGVQTSRKTSAGSVLLDGKDLLAQLYAPSDAARTIIIFDCCHALAFDPLVTSYGSARMCVYACAVDEKAIALNKEQTTRLGSAIAESISRRKTAVDLASVVAEVSELLNVDNVIRGQRVSYRMNGLALVLTRNRSSNRSNETQRTKAVARIRNRLITGAAVLTLALSWVVWFYWAHVFIEIDLAGLSGIASEVTLIGTEENPDNNESTVFSEIRVNGNSVRFWAPATNVVLHLRAIYADSAARAINFHLLLTRSFRLQSKVLSLALPPAADVLVHPNMAFVPAVPWLQGEERTVSESIRAFWIDLRPPTVDEYVLIARGLRDKGVITTENSFVLSWTKEPARVSADSAELPEPAGPIAGDERDIVVGEGVLPCNDCPAPMTRLEAQAYCDSRGMKLPTPEQWELAVRGVDGRRYPWGNLFDKTRANIPELPDKDEASPTLKPVLEHAKQRSPYGLIDTVGNAGDWVQDKTDALDYSFMGGSYRNDHDTTTTFALLPIRGFELLWREITGRCAASSMLSPGLSTHSSNHTHSLSPAAAPLAHPIAVSLGKIHQLPEQIRSSPVLLSVARIC